MSVTDPDAPTELGISPSAPVTAEGDAETVIPSDVDTAAGSTAGGSSRLARGSMVGRYVILDRLGHGGMGVVYSAYDPELDRKLAIKILLHRAGHSSESLGVSRLAREAQAMARLSHPNVVAVHDVGTHAGSVFVAMEFIDGQTLSRWLKRAHEADPIDAREVLRVFLAAGRGIEAAHAAGIVHRDFKPENVMVADDGRVAVLDFGLARPTSEAEAPVERTPVSLSSDSLHGRLTMTGAVMGTPAYMSPEQFEGQRVDARSDQFSFCVALYFGLYGTRPFIGSTVMELSNSVLNESAREPPRRSGVPARVRRALLRGMARDPSRRFASMTELLDVLAFDPAARRRRIFAGIAGGAVVAAAIGVSQYEPRRPDPCVDIYGPIAGAWTDERRAAVDRAFAEDARTYSEFTREAVVEDLDAFVASWRIERVAACRAAHDADPETSQDGLQRARCLDAGARRIDALARLLGDADQSMVANAIEAIDSVTHPAGCRQRAFDRAGLLLPDDEQMQAEVEAVRAEIDRGYAHLLTGRYAPGAEMATATLKTARELGYDPLLVEALDFAATAYNAMGRYSDALPLYEEAILVGRRHGLEGFVADIVVKLAGVHTSYTDNYALATWLLRSARADLEYYDAPPDAFARVDVQLAHAMRGPDRPEDHAAALDVLERAVKAFEELGQEKQVIKTKISMINSLFELDRQEEARELIEEALADARARFGPDHPDVGTLLSMMARSFASRSRHEESVAYLVEARNLLSGAVGEVHPVIMAMDNGLGLELDEVGRYEEAVAAQREALAIGEKVFPDDHPELDIVRQNLGNLLRRTGQAEEALELQRKVVDGRTRRFGPTHSTTLGSRENLADDLRASGQHEAAARAYEAVIADRERVTSDEEEEGAYPRVGLALVYHALGRTPEGIELARRAEQMLDDDRAHYRGLAQYTLAYLLRAHGETEDAKAAAELAQASFREGGGRSHAEDGLADFLRGEDVPPNY